ncbi:succinate--hydroxymethylglutarate CoA-transferase-like [Liolophura sinensis]|uniref:succinate--hydroxymethylglutarate CoA-transferase-like n=1 Tax=Liolophura sinensis TaxID=3198878 RepID=UPI00315944A5
MSVLYVFRNVLNLSPTGGLLNPSKRVLCQRCLHQKNTVAPLKGIRVLDLTRVLAGPYCSMILGDLGAEVVKVERPGVGDDTRAWGPPFSGTESAYFLCVNRNKKSVAINMKDPSGGDLVRKLAEQSDVLIENYLPGKLSEMGLGYDDLKKSAPHLIYCSITGYGQTGPSASQPGYDVIVAGRGGLMHITGPAEGEPCKVGVAMTDLSTGLYAHGAIMAAILQRQATGVGQHIDCNLFSTQVASLVNVASNYLNASMEGQRYGTAHASIVPYQAFPTSDGYLLVGAGNDHQFKELCQILQMESEASDPRFSSNEKRVANRKVLISRLSDRFAKNSTSDWLDLLAGSGIPFGPINTIEQVFKEPQIEHNKMIQEMDHPTAGRIRVPGPPVKYSSGDFPLPSPPPTLGQHTDQVLGSVLGLTDQDLNKLREGKVIQ